MFCMVMSIAVWFVIIFSCNTEKLKSTCIFIRSEEVKYVWLGNSHGGQNGSS